MSKRLAVMLGIVVTVVFGGTVALAQTGSDANTERHLRGTGFLNASGSGSVSIEMGGIIRLAVEGDLTIVDLAGDARVHIVSPGTGRAGAEELAGETTYQLDGFQGVVRVAGSNFTVEVDGFSAFKARGTGSAYLTGEDVWKT
ncbi:MAG: hypothetical protein GY778_07360, partial [bacterium]|nr:hypothetical protein [bacterium]